MIVSESWYAAVLVWIYLNNFIHTACGEVHFVTWLAGVEISLMQIWTCPRCSRGTGAISKIFCQFSCFGKPETDKRRGFIWSPIAPTILLALSVFWGDPFNKWQRWRNISTAQWQWVAENALSYREGIRRSAQNKHWKGMSSCIIQDQLTFPQNAR